jgi:predicted GH43/DUF377 family glycosyl hydrolase
VSVPLHRAEWRRRPQPVLSAMTTREAWCTIQLYNPHVVRVGEKYRMWYLGNNTRTRTHDFDMGLAESDDGIDWTPYPGNPVLSRHKLPFGANIQTPHVVFDAVENIYKMWFIATPEFPGSYPGSGDPWGAPAVDIQQRVCFATSPDGITWDVRPEPVYENGRRPCVLADGSGYQMWMNSMPVPGGRFLDLVTNIYRFTSPDGVTWTRDSEPASSRTSTHRSMVYPFVMRLEDGYIMWHVSHVDGGIVELFCSTSSDGRSWTHQRDRAAFPATRGIVDWDGRYVSTPCVVDGGDRYLLYYSARDWNNLYGAGNGEVKFDEEGIYRHIGVAECPK